jgi:Flp pilus assembly pilin Flp
MLARIFLEPWTKGELKMALGTTLGKTGQGLTEYLILMVLVAVAAIGAATSLGGTIRSKIQAVRTQINSNVSIERAGGD